VILTLLAAGIDAGGVESVDQAGVDRTADERDVEPGGVDGHHGGPYAALQKLGHEPPPRLLPERQVAGEAGGGAHALDPIAVRLQIDVAEHTGLHAALAQLVQRGDVGGLVVVPRRRPRDERQAQGPSLPLQQGKGQAVSTAHATILVQHAEQGLRPAASGYSPSEREVRVLAAAPRAEEPTAGQRRREGVRRARVAAHLSSRPSRGPARRSRTPRGDGRRW
jgi:hypothetical protein